VKERSVPDVLATVAGLFEKSAVQYAVIGGHAVNAWLEPRFTSDIDVTVVANAKELESLSSTLRQAGFDIVRQYGADQPSGPDFIRFANADASVVLEIQVAKTALQHSVVSRAMSSASGARVATPEDLLVLKLIAYRSKDRIDLEGLVRRPSIDWSYVEKQCKDWDVLDRLDEVRPRDH
jgi:hypothetical protein